MNEVYELEPVNDSRSSNQNRNVSITRACIIGGWVLKDVNEVYELEPVNDSRSSNQNRNVSITRACIRGMGIERCE